MGASAARRTCPARLASNASTWRLPATTCLRRCAFLARLNAMFATVGRPHGEFPYIVTNALRPTEDGTNILGTDRCDDSVPAPTGAPKGIRTSPIPGRCDSASTIRVTLGVTAVDVLSRKNGVGAPRRNRRTSYRK